MQRLLMTLVLCAITPGAWAVMKCSSNGSTWYQDLPCPPGATTSILGSSSTGMGASEVPAVPLTPAPLQIQEPPATLPPPPPSMPRQVLQEEAQLCMDWYRKLRPELTGVVTGDFTKEGRVVSIVIPIQQNYLNVYRVLVQNTGYKTASCEIYNGKLDDGWTRIHAKRGGWID